MAEKAATCNVDLAGQLQKAYKVLDDLYTGDVVNVGAREVLDRAIGRTKVKLNALAKAAGKTAKAGDAGLEQHIEMMQTINDLSRHRNIVDQVTAAAEPNTSLQGFRETSRRINGRLDDEIKREYTKQNALARQGFEAQMVGDGTHTPNNAVQHAYDLFEDARAGGDKLLRHLQTEGGFANPAEEIYAAVVNGHHKSNKTLNVIGKALKPLIENLKRGAQEALPGNKRQIREGLNLGVAKDKLQRTGKKEFSNILMGTTDSWKMIDPKLKARATETALEGKSAAQVADMDKLQKELLIKRKYAELMWDEQMVPRGSGVQRMPLQIKFNPGEERVEFRFLQEFSQMGESPLVDMHRQQYAHIKKNVMERTYGSDPEQGFGIQQEALAAAAYKKGFEKGEVDDLLRYDHSRHDLLKTPTNQVDTAVQRIGSVLSNMTSAGYLGKVAIKRWPVDGMIIPAIHRLAYTNSPLRSMLSAVQGAITSFSSIAQAAVRADAYKELEHVLETTGLRIRLSANTVAQHLDEFGKLSTKDPGGVEGVSKKFADGVSSLTGADAQYMGHTVDAAVSLGRDILWTKNREFGKLPAFMKYYFQRNGVGEKEWGLLKTLPTIKAPTFGWKGRKGKSVEIMPDFRAIYRLSEEQIKPYQKTGESAESARSRLHNDYTAAFEDALYERFARPTQQDRVGGQVTAGAREELFKQVYRFIPIANKQWRGWNRAVRAMSGLDPADSSLRGFFEAAATSPKAWLTGTASLAAVAQGGMFIEIAEDLIAGNVPDKDYLTSPARWGQAIMQTGFLLPISTVAQAAMFNSGKLQPSIPSAGVASSLFKPLWTAGKAGVKAAEGRKQSKDLKKNLQKQSFNAASYLVPYSRMWYFQGLMNTAKREMWGLSPWEKRMHKLDKVTPWEKTKPGKELVKELEGK